MSVPTSTTLITETETELQPPLAAVQKHHEVWHGVTYTDDYFWLREKQNSEVRQYLEAENDYTKAVTGHLEPFADALYQEMLSHIKQTDLTVPVRRGAYFYYTRTEEGKQYPIYCRRHREAREEHEQILLDLNQLGQGHPFIGLDNFSLSDDQNLLAYTLDYTGFRQYTLHVKNLHTGEELADTAQRVTSVEWAADNRTLFLTTEDAVTKRSDKLWRHVLGSETQELLFEETDEVYDIGLGKSRDRKFLFLTISSKDTTECRYLAVNNPAEAFSIFLPRRSKHRYYLDHREELFYIRTNRQAKDFEIVTAPVSDHRPENWQTFVPPVAGRLVEDIDLFRSFAVSIEKSEALNRLRVYSFASGSWQQIDFTETVYAAFPGSTPDYESATYRYSYQSFITPPSVFDYEPVTGTSTLLKRQEVPGGYDPSQYATERLWATGRDGTCIPLSIVYKRGYERNGSQPLFLYGYGSYGIGMPAAFSSSRLVLLDRGMAYGIAHIRGGDELGEQWREDGMLMKKKNTFFDFIDAAEYLIRDKWTSPDRLVIEGGSAGGLLMGAVVNLRPDLFGAVHAAVPFVDVVNTMMDASLPLTVGEYLEWGNPNELSAFEYMRSYSPYDNLEQRAYPAMLVTTSFNDSQVMYWEPAKYVARLRRLKTNDTPLLLKIKMEPAGHGGASGRYDRLKDTAFEYAWLLSQVGITQ